MRLKGKVSPGVLRGELLIEKFFYRIKAILGFEPYKGTLDVKLEKPVEIEDFATKAIDHILVDGSRMVEAHLAPIILHVEKDGMQDHECWAIRPSHYTHGKEMVEIINKEKLKEKFALKDGDEVEVTFFEQRRPKKGPPGIGLMRRLYRREHRLSV